jgi:hypothetical protein
MSTYITDFIKKNKQQFQKYNSYIENNDWTELTIDSILKDEYFSDVFSAEKEKAKKAETVKLIAEFVKKQKDTVKSKSDEYHLQKDLVLYILNRLTAFIKKTQGEHNNSKLKKFVEYSLEIVKTHTDRIDKYLYSIDITKIENQEVRSDEIKLTKECHEGINRIDEIVSSLNITEEQVAQGIQWLDRQKASVAMHETVAQKYPEVAAKVQSMGIDFTTPPPNEIHILNENPPEYNPNKNYWEQDVEVLQYYVNELKKIERGITIDGYYIDGWLYFHFNYFVTNVPKTIYVNGLPENKDETKVPDLRDNEIMITEYFNKSKRDGTLSFISATRRAAKTTMNSSRIARAQVLGKRQILCAGGSAEDLNHIHNNLEIHSSNVHPAFKLYYLSATPDGRGKTYGIKGKDNKSVVVANVYILNLEGGSNTKKKESLAGFTPDEFILDEAMKFPYKKQLEALESALWADGILRCFVLLTGTGGDTQLAVDAIKMLNNPRDYKVTLMDWDLLEKGVPPELITWKRRDYGLFLPTQMCTKHRKIKSNLADYLGIKSKTLSKVTLWVTDWENAKKDEERDRLALIKDKESHTRLLAYHPFDPDDIFLSGEINPYPVEALKKRKRFLEETGDTGRKVFLVQGKDGKITAEDSNKEVIQYRGQKGSFQDAPVLLYTSLPEVIPPANLYVAGFDDYKQDESGTDSVGSFHIYKVNIGMDKWCGRIVASLATRPDPHEKLHKQIFLLMKAFNARCFMENADDKFKTFLERKKVADLWLQHSLDFKSDMAQQSTGKKKYGWNPSPQNIKFLKNLAEHYANEEIEIEDEDGNAVTVLGCERLNDIELIQEMIDYKKENNTDRITSFMSCLGLEFYLDCNYMFPTSKNFRKETEEKPKPKQQKTLATAMFGNRRSLKHF